MQPNQTSNTAGVYAQNLRTMLQAISATKKGDADAPRKLTLSVERVLANRRNGELVPYAGEGGIEDFLHEFSASWPQFHEQWYTGHLMGLHGLMATTAGRTIKLAISLGPGGQITCTAGPSSHIEDMRQAIEAFDQQLHTVSRGIGEDYVLLSEGYNPVAKSPLDVPLVPRTCWTLLNAHLGKTGRYARDAMRCECATHVELELVCSQRFTRDYQVAVALAPLLTFLTDNVRTFRDTDARRTQRMTRSVIWEEVDSSRCGVVPGTFETDFAPENYLSWLEGIQPIMFVDQGGVTSSTGKQTIHDVMEQRELTQDEAHNLLGTVFPLVRIGANCIQILQADSLRPRMAAAYAAFIKGLFASEFSVEAAGKALGSVSEEGVAKASLELRLHGWNAVVYGQDVSRVVDSLLQIARTELDVEERGILNEIAEQWEVHMVPRDAFVHQAIKAARGW